MATRELLAAAVDLGASSGRVVLGRVGPDRLDAEVVHRFANDPSRRDGHLRWDLAALEAGMLDGLAAAVARGRSAGGVTSAGVDTWAVDYGLLDPGGRLLADPVHYRDERTAGLRERLRPVIGDEEWYGVTGLQFLPFNTAYQLVAEEPELLARAEHLLMVPDLLVQRLTGAVAAERTNASTTQLYDVRAGRWSAQLIDALGLPRRLFPEVVDPGSAAGVLLPAVRERTGDDGRLTVHRVGSHDTASAVLAVPAEGERFAYISCGTWSLVGVELDAPVLTADSLAADFTNETGVDGTVRYLRNVTGMWLLEESRRQWRREGDAPELGELLAAAAAQPARRSVIDADDPSLAAPGDVPGRIRELCRRTGQEVPATPAAVVRCIVDSLALAHAETLADAVRLSGREVDVVHVVGGGALNALLMQATADACGLPVLAGPAEATALGNLLAQARAAGVVGGREHARELLRRTQRLVRYEPRDTASWRPLTAGVPVAG
ncbi:rhamnulokinase [Kineococcus xinjiangensis]|uniref:Rhamnulokinase n=1 Tax=Kineococcus xinjiangensis TaxID=512762 RepID=A0A2S6IGX8_9ACTN|nr:rhamnulokinase family protein [Kineococcus xinjiangensis]PPK93472.1 rhamnulokinase [Kineococcus xinjiangensis]